MKQAMNNTRKITILLVTIFTMGLCNLTKGFSQASLTGSDNQSPIEFKYVSKVDNHPLFQLNMNNKEDDEFQVRVKDGEGNVLYSETLKGTKVWRQYLMDISEDDFNDDGFKLRFEVKKVKTHESFVYNVTRDTRIVTDIIVAKL